MKLPTSLIEFLMQEDEVEDALQSYALDQTDERKKRLLETILSEIDSGKHFLTLPYAKCDTCKKHLKDGEVCGNGMKDLCAVCARNEEEEEREEEEKRIEATLEKQPQIIMLPHFYNHVPEFRTRRFNEYNALAAMDKRLGEIFIRIKAAMQNIHELGGCAVLVRFEVEEWMQPIQEGRNDFFQDQLRQIAMSKNLNKIDGISKFITYTVGNMNDISAQQNFYNEVCSVVKGIEIPSVWLSKAVDTRFSKNIPGAK